MPSTLPVFHYYINCRGSESTITDCVFVFEGECNATLQAAVVCPALCLDGDIRLVGTLEAHTGLVLICYEDRWYGICDESWSTNDAIVACHQLGYTGLGSSNILIYCFNCYCVSHML